MVEHMNYDGEEGGQYQEIEGAEYLQRVPYPAPLPLPRATGLYEWKQEKITTSRPIPQPVPVRRVVEQYSQQELQAQATSTPEIDAAALFPWIFTREELRLDVDGRYPQMAASGTVYRLLSTRVHWVANLTSSGVNTWSGPIWYKNGDATALPYTNVQVQVVRSWFANQRRATVTFSGGGAPSRVLTYKYKSQSFQSVEFEFDRAEDAIQVTSIVTCAHPNRPAMLACENLSIENVYRRAGFNVSTSAGSGTVPKALAGANGTWSDMEMHDAMQVYWSHFANKPQWSMWTFFAAQLAASTILLVSAQFLADNTMRRSLNDVIVWTALIGTVVFTSGLAQRAGVDAARQRDAANVRVSRLAEANSLLFALQRVAQSMPASLDLDDVVDSTLKRVSSLVPADSLVLYLVNDTDRQLEVFRAIGSASAPTLSLDRLPVAIQPAVESPRTVREPHLADGSSLTADGVSGLYTALRARGNLLGLLVIECSHPDAHTQQHSEIVHGLAESFGIAIDNARLFRQIRAASVNEERARIARDLHDHIGSSLAFLGFEVDRAQALAARGEAVDETLAELRGHITGVINEIRETLHDLRTDVTDDRDLPRVLGDHLARVRSRTTLSITADIHASFRPPRPVERELWQLALEAITNVERHARAAIVHVEYRAVDSAVFLRIEDDGVGLNTAAPATDRYGMVGMRERAERIGATLRHEPMIPHRAAGTGTRVTIELCGDLRRGEATT